MDANQIKNMGRRLREFLGEFDDCFVRSKSRQHLRTYVGGQVSSLPRKNIEPIALAAKVRPRTLQFFLSSAPWTAVAGPEPGAGGSGPRPSAGHRHRRVFSASQKNPKIVEWRIRGRADQALRVRQRFVRVSR